MCISVMDVEGNPDPSLTFPAPESGNLLYVDDSISIGGKNILQNAPKSDQFSRAVFFSYASMHEVLSEAPIQVSSEVPMERLRINSRVLSVSLGRAGKHLALTLPAVVTLRHLDLNVTAGGQVWCVYWDLASRHWSDTGCSVKMSNVSTTVCQCDHLTAFAVVVRPEEGVAVFFGGVADR